MTLDGIAARMAQDHLDVFGAFHTTDSDEVGAGRTVVLLGPHEPGFWAHFKASPEYQETRADPLDRWSKRVITAAADDLDGEVRFPFDEPHPPFLSWAVRSGRAWPSPVHLLVHHTAGLWVSYRGAFIFPDRLDLPPPAQNPCDTCANQPCRTSCPVQALTDAAYDLHACHAYLDSAQGQDCLHTGCAVRKSCPQSQKYHRVDAQNDFHMDAFHR